MIGCAPWPHGGARCKGECGSYIQVYMGRDWAEERDQGLGHTQKYVGRPASAWLTTGFAAHQSGTAAAPRSEPDLRQSPAWARWPGREAYLQQ